MDRTRWVALAGVAAALLITAACTNSGLGQDTAPDSGAPDTTPTGGGGGGACAWEGTWAMSGAPKCGSFEVGNWAESYGAVTMTVTENPSGGCDLAVEWTGPDCGESESYFADPPSDGGDVELTANGVTSCQQDGCVFDSNDEAGCAVGDREGDSVPVVVDASVADTLVLTGFGAHAWTPCTLAFITTWAKQ